MEACVSVSSAGCTWWTCICGTARPAGSAAPRTFTSVTGPATRNGAEAKTKHPVAGAGRHGDGRADQAGQSGDGAHLFRLHDQRISRATGHGTGCCWSSCTARTRAAVGDSRSPADAWPRRGTSWAGQGKTARVPALASPRAVLEASGGDLLIARDAGGWASTAVVDEIYAPRRRARQRVRRSAAHGLG